MKQQGELIELAFYYKAYQKGIIISKPFGDNAKYDFITDKNGLKRIQVKSSSCKDTSVRNNTYKIATSHGGSIKKIYSKKDIDFFACYIIPEDTWYIIPVEEVNTIRLSLFPHVLKSFSKYEKFKEAWDLL